jgi:tRNA G18 (ribose-2'-O)-methylase SpoU
VGHKLIVSIANSEDLRLEPYCKVRERDLVGRDGLFIAEGKIVLSLLLASKDHRLESVLLLDSRVQSNTTLVSKIPEATPVYVVPQAVMDTVAGFHVHRGILAIGRRTAMPAMTDLIASAGPDALIVVLSGISNHDNVGSIFRNAAAFSADAIVLDNLCCDPLYRKALRVSVGGVLTVPWAKCAAIDEILNALSDNGFSVAALSPAGNTPVKNLPATGRRALLLGSEGHGLPEQLLQSLQTYRIPMSQSFDSLNVATASGIALFSASRYSA